MIKKQEIKNITFKPLKLLAIMLLVLVSNLNPFLPKTLAAVRDTMNFQGKVVNSNGTNVADNTYDFVFKIYDGAASTANLLWTETWSSAALWSSAMITAPGLAGETLVYTSGTNESTIKVGQALWNATKQERVTITSVDTGTNTLGISPTRQAWAITDTITNAIFVKDGLFSLELNSLNENWGTIDWSSASLFLGVNFNSDGEMKPRKRLTSVPYAKNANRLTAVANDITLSNIHSTAFTTSTTLTGALTGFNLDLSTNVVDGNYQVKGIALTLPDSGSALSYGLYISGEDANYFSGNVGIGTTGPVSKLQVSGGAVLFDGATGSTPVSGAGTRLMWIPEKAAFRVGTVSDTAWNDANIGTYSMALGQDTTASGTNSVAFGVSTTASGYTATAFGAWGNIASGGYSAVLGGYQNTASGSYSAAIGRGNAIGGYSSVGIGRSNTIDAGTFVGATAIGYLNTITSGVTEAWGALALGRENSAASTGSIAIGYGNVVNNTAAIGMGYYTSATGSHSIAIGSGASTSNRLTNSVADSLMVGFNSTIPTFYIGPSSGAGTSGNVGIGTTGPSSQLTLRKDGAEIKLETVSNPGEFYSTLTQRYSSGNPFTLTAAFRGGTIETLKLIDVIEDSIGGSPKFSTRFATATGNLYLATAGTDKVTLTTAGNVGIGTTAPTHKLELADHTTAAGGLAFGTDVELYRSGANNLTLASGDSLNLASSTNLVFGGTTSLGESTSATDSGAYMVGVFDEFDNSGSTNVQGVLNDLDTALTTGGAGAMWTLAGGVVYPTSATNDFAIGGSTLAASMFGIDESAGNFYFGADNSANPSFLFEATDSDAGTFGFNTNDAFYISGANVGIGTTAPNALMDILGTSTQLRLSYDGTYYTNFTIDATGKLALAPNGTTAATFSNIQNTFDVPTSFTAAGDVSMAYDLLFTNQTAANIQSNAPLYIEAGESFENNDLILRTFGSGDLVADLGTSGSFLPMTDNTHDLGSIANRWKTLHVGPGSVVVHNDATDTSKVTLGFSSAVGKLYTDSATPLQMTTGANIGIYLSTGGNVGIGTTAPVTLFEVRKDQDTETKMQVTNTSTGTSAFNSINLYNGANYASYSLFGSSFTTSGTAIQNSSRFWTDAPGGLSFVSGHSSGPIRFYPGGMSTPQLYISTGGNVGIGTTTPFATLDLGTVLGDKLVLYHGTNINDSYGLGVVAGRMYARTSATNEAMVWTNTGNVGIGTTAPSATLQVVGTLAFPTDSLEIKDTLVSNHHTVCSSGCDYTTIQSAITAASNGDVILIYPGTYSENLTLSGKIVNLMGSTNNYRDVIIQGYLDVTLASPTKDMSLSNLSFQPSSGTYALRFTGTGDVNYSAFLSNIYIYNSQSSVSAISAIENSTTNQTVIVQGDSYILAYNSSTGGSYGYYGHASNARIYVKTGYVTGQGASGNRYGLYLTDSAYGYVWPDGYIKGTTTGAVSTGDSAFISYGGGAFDGGVSGTAYYFSKLYGDQLIDDTITAAKLVDTLDLDAELTINGQLVDIGGGTYSYANGDNDLGIAGDLEVSGTAYFGSVGATGNILPTTDNTYNLGSATYRWANLYLAPASLHISDTTGTSGAGTDYVDGSLLFSGEQFQLKTTLMGAQATGGNILFQSGYPAGGTTTPAIELKTSTDLATGDQLFRVGDSAGNFMTITGAGNVGIGTTEPIQKLHIVSSSTPALLERSNAGTSVTNGSSWLQINNPDPTDGNYAGLTFNGFRASDLSTLVNYGGIYGVFSDHSNVSGDIAFITRDVNVLYERMRIKSSGNVGIGTTSPDASLAVNGDIKLAGGELYFGTMGVGTGEFISRAGANSLHFYVGGGDMQFNVNYADRLVIANDGNVGVGSDTTPDYMLDVQGTLHADGTTTIDGNVGIGTTSPNKKLHIQDNTDATLKFALQLTNTGTNTNTATGVAFGVQDPNYFKGALIYQRESDSGGYAKGDFHFLQNSAADNTYPTLSNAVFTIKNTGNIGIGTTAPLWLLHLQKDQDAVTIGGLLNAGTGTGSRTGFVVGEAATGGKYGFFGYQNNSYTPAGGEEQLTANRFIVYGGNTGGLGLGAANASGNIILFTGGTATANERMRITSTGNVGIGTTNPGYDGSKLEVNGSISTYATDPFIGYDSGNGIRPRLAANTVALNTSGSLYLNIDTNNNDADTQAFYFNKNAGNTTGSNLVTILETGNVGIGTTAPAAGLHVGTGGTPSFAGANDVYIQNDLEVGGTAYFGSVGATGNILPTTDNTYNLGSATYRWANLYLAPASLHISDTTGTSGAGTDYVDGSLLFSGEQFQLKTTLMGAQATGGNILFQSAFPAGGTTTPAIELKTSTDLATGDQLFRVGDSAANFMTITGAGNVGIGTTSPTAKLDILGRAYIIDAGANTFVTGGNTTLSGEYNVAMGGSALTQVTSGTRNVGLGHQALSSNTTGSFNVAVGINALSVGTTGSENVAIGDAAMGGSDVTGSNNTALGNGALYTNQAGAGNIALGQGTMQSNSGGNYNFAAGRYALDRNTTGGDYNLGIGDLALRYNITGDNNIALGQQAGYGVADSSNVSNNIILGYQAGHDVLTGADSNIFIGYQAGDNVTTGARNIIIGYNKDAPSATGSDQLNIGGAIYGDLSTGNVGIGTSGPRAKLEVNGDIIKSDGETGIWLRGSKGQFGMQSQPTGFANDMAIVVASDSSPSRYLRIGYYPSDNTGNTFLPQVSINGYNGNVGIGTTSPGATLDINSTFATTGFPLRILNTGYYNMFLQGTSAANQAAFYMGNDRSSSTTPNTSYGGFLYGGSTNALGNLFGISRADTLMMFADGASNLGMVVGTRTIQPFYIGTNDAIRMTILGTGNVGIGTTSPAQLLDVVNTSDNAGISIRSGLNKTAGLYLYDNTTLLGSISDAASTGSEGSIALYSGATQNVSIRANYQSYFNGGNVGIGTTGPAKLLDLYSAAYSASTAITLGHGAVAHGVTGELPTSSFGLIFNHGGNGGGLQITGASDAASQNPLTLLGLGGAGLSDTIPAIIFEGAQGSGTARVAQESSDTTLLIRNYTTDLVTVKASGNVGIGTTSPGTKLEVTGSIFSNQSSSGANVIAFQGINNGDGGTGSSSTLRMSSKSGYMADIRVQSRQGVGIPSFQNPEIAFYTLNTDTSGDGNLAQRMVIQSGGNVGIGTTAPTHKLELADHTTAAGGLAFGTDVELYRSGANNLTLASGDSFNLASSTNLVFGGTTSLGESTSATDSGAYMVGVFDEFDNSASTNVQGVLNDLDTAISTGGAGAMWTLASGVIYPTSATNDFAIGGSTLAVSMFGIDESAGNFYFGADNSANPSFLFEATDSDAGTFGFNTNDAFYISGANVGIGTTAPNALMDILGTATQLRLSYDASYYTNFIIDATGKLTVAPNGTTAATFSNIQNTFDVPTSFTSAGDVDIANNLNFSNVSGAIIKSDAGLAIQAGGGIGNYDLVLAGSGTGDVVIDDTYDLELYAGQKLVFDVDDASDTYALFDSTNNFTQYYVDGTNVMNMTSGGNVGIGTTAPGYKLHVQGSGDTYSYVETTGASNLSYFGVKGTVGSAGLAYVGSDALYGNQAVLLADGSTAALNLRADKTDGYMRFFTGGYAAGNERMRIDSGGNVGIGTTGPGDKLSVNGWIRTLAGSGGGFSAYDAMTGGNHLFSLQRKIGANDLSISSYDGIGFTTGATSGPSDSYQVYIKNGGNVGIGTTNPGAKLDVNGAIWAASGNKIQFATASEYLGYNVGGGGISLLTSYYPMTVSVTGSTYDLTLSSTGGDVVLQPTAGNVGIGTTGPRGALELSRVNSSNELYLTQTGGGDYSTSIYLSSNEVIGSSVETQLNLSSYANSYTPVPEYAGKAGIQASTNKNLFLTTRGTGDLEFYLGGRTAADKKIVFKSTGNVGIGTTAPGAKLNVTSTGADLVRFTTAANWDILEFQSSDAALSASNIRFAQSLRTGNTSLLMYGYDGSTFKSFWNADYTNNKFYFTTSTAAVPTSSVLTVDLGNGNVGIGTTGPSEKLDVRGNALIGYEGAGTNNYLSIRGNFTQANYTGHLIMSESATYRGIIGYDEGGNTAFSFDNSYAGAGSQYLWKFANTAKMELNSSGNLQLDGVLNVDGIGNSYIQGNVGIGTTGPGTLLEVSGAGSNVFEGLRVTNTTSSKDVRITLKNGNADKLYLTYEGFDDTRDFRISRILSGGAEVNYMVFDQSGNASLPIGTLTVSGTGNSSIAGNVGIGTTGPGAALHVTNLEHSGGNVAIIGGYVDGEDGAGLLVNSAIQVSTLRTDIAGVKIQPTIAGHITGAEATNYRGLYIPTPIWTGDVTNAYGLYVNAPTQGTSVNAAAIFNGNVGIGTTGPSYLFDVAGVTRINPTETTYPFGMLITGSVDRSAYGVAQAVSALKINTALKVDNNPTLPGRSIYGLYANLGTMTGFPAAANNTFADIAITPATVSLPSGANLANRIGLYIDSAVAGGINNYAIYAAGTSDKSYFGGNVGIGTTEPGTKLHISKASASKYNLLTLENGASSDAESGGAIFFKGWNNQALITAYNNPAHSGGGNLQLQTYANDGATLNTGLFISTTGNVGIGTTAPGTKLAVAGLTGTASYNLVRVDTATGNFYYDSSSEKYKENIQPFETDFSKILNVTPKLFTDKASQQREIGFIAEDFDLAGLNDLVIYDQNGNPNGLKYDKVPLYQLGVLKQQQQQIEQLQLASDNSTNFDTEDILSKTSAIEAALNQEITNRQILASRVDELAGNLELMAGQVTELQNDASQSANIIKNFSLSVAGDLVLSENLVLNENLKVGGKTTLAQLEVGKGLIVGSIATDGSTDTSMFSIIHGSFSVTSGSGTQGLYQDTNAKVGIGTTSPAALLSVGAVSQFQVDASGNLKTSGTITLGSDENTVVLGTDAAAAERAGTARRVYRISLKPEYEGAVKTADGTNNIGTMTSNFCSKSYGSMPDINATSALGCPTAGDNHSFSQWTTTQANAQDYDIFLRVQVPSDFSAWAEKDPMYAYGFKTTGSDGVTITMYDSKGEKAVNAVAVATENATWTETSLGENISGTYSAGSYITLIIHMSATNGNFARVGEIRLDYLSKYK